LNASGRAHRAAAAFALGHAMDPSPERIRTLVEASSDPDDLVRNNAVRSLSE
jgi:HEAT repeat protein